MFLWLDNCGIVTAQHSHVVYSYFISRIEKTNTKTLTDENHVIVDHFKRWWSEGPSGFSTNISVSVKISTLEDCSFLQRALVNSVYWLAWGFIEDWCSPRMPGFLDLRLPLHSYLCINGLTYSLYLHCNSNWTALNIKLNAAFVDGEQKLTLLALVTYTNLSYTQITIGYYQQ